MCGPAIGILSAVASAAGPLVSSMMQAQSYKTQAAQADRQAQIERDLGAFESQREREQHRRVAGEQRAAYLASGVALEGTPTDVIIDSGQENEMDVQAIKYGAQIRSDNYAFSAQMARLNAGQATAGGAIGALSPLIGGFKSLGGTQLSSGFS